VVPPFGVGKKTAGLVTSLNVFALLDHYNIAGGWKPMEHLHPRKNREVFDGATQR